MEGLLDIVVNRLESAGSMTGLYRFISPLFSSTRGYTYVNPRDSITLISSLPSHATDAHWDELTLEIERLNIPKAVVRLMASHIIEDFTSSILDFHANMVRVVYRLKATAVDPED